MELDTTTIILELINFVILVWILKRFLFKPVISVMDKRQAELNQSISHTRQLHDEALQERAQYESRLEEWEKEKESARAQLNKELAEQRLQGEELARNAALKETTRLQASEDKRRTDWQRMIESRALHQGATFTSRLLARLSDEHLDEKMTTLLLKDLKAWPPEKIQPLTEAALNCQGKIMFISARPLSSETVHLLEASLPELLQTACHYHYETDETMMAGVRIRIGALALHANIKDELSAFVESGAHSG